MLPQALLCLTFDVNSSTSFALTYCTVCFLADLKILSSHVPEDQETLDVKAFLRCKCKIFEYRKPTY